MLKPAFGPGWNHLPTSHYMSTPRFVIYADKDDKGVVVIFSEAYAAAHFIDALLDGINPDTGLHNTDYEFISPDHDLLLTADALEVRCDRLPEIFEHCYTSEEHRWRLPLHYRAQVDYLLYGEAPDPLLQRTSSNRHRGLSALPQRERENLMGIRILAAKLGLTPQQARSRLRKAGHKKPDIGWHWRTEDEVTTLAEQLRSIK